MLIPSELSGAGTATLIVNADGVQSNPVTVELGGVDAHHAITVAFAESITESLVQVRFRRLNRRHRL